MRRAPRESWLGAPSERRARLAVAAVIAAVMVGVVLGGCDGPEEIERARLRRELAVYNDVCRDSTALLATTAGSPDTFQCPNRRHRIEVATATLAGEEVATTVTCRCSGAVPDRGMAR